MFAWIQLVFECIFFVHQHIRKTRTCFVGINLQWKFVAVSTVHLHVVCLFGWCWCCFICVATLALSHNMCINSYVHTPTYTAWIWMRHMHLHKLHEFFNTGKYFRWENTRKCELLPCISTFELTMLNFGCAIRWKSTKFSWTPSHTHIDFVLLLKCANQKTEHAYQYALFFRFHSPSISLIHSNASDT